MPHRMKRLPALVFPFVIAVHYTAIKEVARIEARA